MALLARLYLEVRARGFDVACGIMSPRARSLVRLLGLQRRGARRRSRVLGRAAGARPLQRHRSTRRRSDDTVALTADRPVHQRRAPSTSAVFMPPKPNEFESAGPGADGSRLAADDVEVDRSDRSAAVRPRAARAPPASDRSVTIASTAPEPAMRWPVVPFTAVTGSRSPGAERRERHRFRRVPGHGARAVRVHVAQVVDGDTPRRPAPPHAGERALRRRRSARRG